MTDQRTTEPLDDLLEVKSGSLQAPDRRPPDRPAEPGDVAETDDDLPTVRAQRDEYRDRLLRVSADFDNYRKRVARERQELIETAGVDLLRELLPLVDDLERALQPEVGTGSVAAYRDGIELIHRQLLDLLRRRGVTPIDALGAPFDPHVHQAVTHEPSAEHNDGEVMAELRRGYRLGERLLRPAMVKVARA